MSQAPGERRENALLHLPTMDRMHMLTVRSVDMRDAAARGTQGCAQALVLDDHARDCRALRRYAAPSIYHYAPLCFVLADSSRMVRRHVGPVRRVRPVSAMWTLR